MATPSSLPSSMASEVAKLASCPFFLPPLPLLAPPATEPVAEAFWLPRVASLLAYDCLEPFTFLPGYLLLALLDFTG